MSLAKKVKTALDENRLLILGAQVLFGFQLHSVFQEAFDELAASTKFLPCAGQFLMALSIGLLIAPSMQHRLVEEGEDSNRIHRVTGRFAGCALLPFEISLGIATYVVFDHLYGRIAAFVAGSAFCSIAFLFWYGLGFVVRLSQEIRPMPEEEKPTPLPTKIDQMLTEARVVLPGAQALLGFQLTVTLTRAFGELPAEAKLLHVIALCCVGMAVILLMTPAALHRISFKGEDTRGFFQMGSGFVIAAPVMLAFGITGDLYVATYQSVKSSMLGAAIAVSALLILAVLWFAAPLYLRWKLRDGHR
jgi:hypothetical protein